MFKVLGYQQNTFLLPEIQEKVTDMSDMMFIHGLRFHTQIGTHTWEQQIKQLIIADIDLTLDLSRASKSDKLEDTLDYALLCKKITKFVEDYNFNLLEALADALAKFILQEFKVEHITLKLTKPVALPHLQAAGVIIKRDNH